MEIKHNRVKQTFTRDSNSLFQAVSNKDTRKKSSAENRIAAVHQSIQNQPPSSVKVKKEPSIENARTPRKTIKVIDIASEVVKRKRGRVAVDKEDDDETIVIDEVYVNDDGEK
ncbi:10692_t:CDS:2 [Paraglomus brasilianum]|uniref:10692_t:CDS:1 n=1 Tax=Paraglomus brasilianum TaxID=144538 RepID=A0A9N9GMX8_9GLOM|nr:10692_t:CDS:2 [Paraglomus brasilianum]